MRTILSNNIQNCNNFYYLHLINLLYKFYLILSNFYQIYTNTHYSVFSGRFLHRRRSRETLQLSDKPYRMDFG